MNTLQQILLSLGQIGAAGGQSLATAMQAQGSPLAYQQNAEAQRQHGAILAQLNMRQTLTPFESASIAHTQLQDARQAQLDQQQAGLNVWHILQIGATLTAGTPDFAMVARVSPCPNSTQLVPPLPLASHWALPIDCKSQGGIQAALCASLNSRGRVPGRSGGTPIRMSGCT